VRKVRRIEHDHEARVSHGQLILPPTMRCLHVWIASSVKLALAPACGDDTEQTPEGSTDEARERFARHPFAYFTEHPYAFVSATVTGLPARSSASALAT